AARQPAGPSQRVADVAAGRAMAEVQLRTAGGRGRAPAVAPARRLLRRRPAAARRDVRDGARPARAVPRARRAAPLPELRLHARAVRRGGPGERRRAPREAAPRRSDSRLPRLDPRRPAAPTPLSLA